MVEFEENRSVYDFVFRPLHSILSFQFGLSVSDKDIIGNLRALRKIASSNSPPPHDFFLSTTPHLKPNYLSKLPYESLTHRSCQRASSGSLAGRSPYPCRTLPYASHTRARRSKGGILAMTRAASAESSRAPSSLICNTVVK